MVRYADEQRKTGETNIGALAILRWCAYMLTRPPRSRFLRVKQRVKGFQDPRLSMGLAPL